MNIEKKVRQKAFHLMRSGSSVQEVATACKRSKKWVYKWRARYEAEGYAGLEDQQKAPKKHGRKLSQAMSRTIMCIISELEAASGEHLKYIGPKAVRTRLKIKRIKGIPNPSAGHLAQVAQKSGEIQLMGTAVKIT